VTLVNKYALEKIVTAHLLFGSIAFLFACGITTIASGKNVTLRIVSYNIEDDTGTTTPLPGLIAPSSGGSVTNGGVLEGIGEEIVAGDPAQPIDILALQETTSNSSSVQPIVNGLNIFYSVHSISGISAVYAMSTYQATESGGSPSGGNGPNALVYNTNTVQLLASIPVDPPGGTSKLGSASGEYREVMPYEFISTTATIKRARVPRTRPIALAKPRLSAMMNRPIYPPILGCFMSAITTPTITAVKQHIRQSSPTAHPTV
jgi:hypothetical protein